MSYTVRNFIGTDAPNSNIDVTQSLGGLNVIEYDHDLSPTVGSAQAAYFAYQMNVHKRQLVCDLEKGPVVVQAGAMQWMLGDISMTSDVKGVGDLIGKSFKSKATKESAIKPRYAGHGVLTLEPTYKHLILTDPADWGGAVVLDDGLFLACDAGLKQSVAARSNIGSALAGGEGLFNLCLSGSGAVCLESDCPKEELIEIELVDDVIKIDGNYAVAWSAGLSFTVERSGKSLIGSAASGEGLVNVYRGTGRVWMEPLAKMPNI